MKFMQKKDIIAELLIEQYGREYEQFIKERLSNLVIDFSSLPDQEYLFLQRHGDQLNEKSKLIIESRYIKYMQAKQDAWMKSVESINDYAAKYLSIKCPTPGDNPILFNLRLGEGYIDSLGSRSMQILSDPNMSESVKNSILEQQIEFNNQISQSISQHDVDKFIEYRNSVKKQYRMDIIEKSEFCKNVFKEFVNKWETPIPAEFFARIMFDYNSFASSFSITYDDNNIVIPYITIKYLNLKNKSMKCFDTNIIHEVIHTIEIGSKTNKFGLKTSKSDFTMTNEIKTQLLAIKIAGELHRRGIFILDDPNDYMIQGQSAYEWLFPFVQDFFERNKKIILNCAIDETSDILEYFGDSYRKFDAELLKIFKDFTARSSREEPLVATQVKLELISGIINEMENYNNQQQSSKTLTTK